MPLLESATTYLLDLLLKNEAVKKFPQDFVTASTPCPLKGKAWVRSWFLTDDPVTEKIIESSQPPPDSYRGQASRH